MAVEEKEQTANEEMQAEGGGNRGTAVKAAAAAAATGVAAIAAKKALSGRGHGDEDTAKNGGRPSKGEGGESLISSMISGGWEAARDSLLPIAEDAAAAAGEFLAQNGPDVIRERIVPRFIESFNEAGGGS